MDTVSEFCTRIRNAVLAKQVKVDVPSSNMRKGIAEQLKNFGYIKNYTVVNDGKQGIMRVYLRYNDDEQPAITQIERLSKPSCRHYVKSDKIPEVLAGYGLLILSTNQGVLSGEAAKKNNVGGELLCRVW